MDLILSLIYSVDLSAGVYSHLSALICVLDAAWNITRHVSNFGNECRMNTEISGVPCITVYCRCYFDHFHKSDDLAGRLLLARVQFSLARHPNLSVRKSFKAL